jgi:predicted DNA binding CopG/RHH family protein
VIRWDEENDAGSSTNGMEVSMKGSKLDHYEKEIERQGSEYIPVSGRKRQRIESILERSKKTKNINIRINEFDLENLRKRSEEEGIPYQTLITSVLHKYVTDQLVEEKNILKSLKLIGRKNSLTSPRP